MKSAEEGSGHASKEHTFHAVSILDHIVFKLTELRIEIIPDNPDEIQKPVPPIKFTSTSPKMQSGGVEGTDTGFHYF